MPLLPLEDLTFYLPFPDGVLQYVCAECNAHCCRGFGFGGSLSREMRSLFNKYPALETAVTSRRGDIVWLQDHGACPFLRDDNFCQIELTHGKQSKPGVCGLFPFNKFSRLSENIIVISPHFLCPLRVVLPRGSSVEGSHQKIIEAAKESGMLDSAYFAIGISPMNLAPKQSAQDALRQEVSFRDKCSDALERSTFFDVLCGDGAESLHQYLRRSSAVCGILYEPNKKRDYLDDIFLALAASWRIEMLHLTQPRMIRVLALAEVLVRRLALLPDRRLSPQQVHKMYADFMPALLLLSMEDTPLRLPKSMQKVPSFGDSKLTFAAYTALRGAEKYTLSGFEDAFHKDLSTSERMSILQELGTYTNKVLQSTKKR
jgi:hypothetical protein